MASFTTTRNAILAATAAVMLSACAMSSADLADASLDQTMTSDKAPQVVGRCAADALNDHPKLENDGGRYWFVRKNAYGVPAVRWDFHPRDGGGTNVEMRAPIPINSGDEKVRACL